MQGKKVTLFRRLLIPLLLVLLSQALLIYGIIIFSGTLTELRQNAMDIYAEKVENRKNILQNEMIQRWSNLGESMGVILEHTAAYLSQNNMLHSDFAVNDPRTNDFLAGISGDIVYLLRKNSVTGAFIILGGQDESGIPQAGQVQEKAGIYLRDMDPESNPGDVSDLLAERAPSLVTKALGVPMDSLWRAQFRFSGDDLQSCAYYYKPYLAALESPGIGWENLGYWSEPFYLNPGNSSDATPVMTYSVPLISEEGVPFGVLGVEISVDHLYSFLPRNEFNTGTKEGYCLALRREDSPGYQAMVLGSAYLRQIFSASPLLDTEDTATPENIYSARSTGSGTDDLFACVQPLRLYNTYTPFEGDQWALVGVVEQDSLLRFTHSVARSLTFTLLLSLAIGLVGAYLISRHITAPITSLAETLRRSDSTRPIHLRHLGISEIDELSQSIEFLSNSVADASSNLTQVISLAGIQMGAFEYVTSLPRVFCTDTLVHILGCASSLENGYVPTEEFSAAMKRLEEHLESSSGDGNIHIYKTGRADGSEQWLRLNIIREEKRVLGVITDITQETLEKRKIEHERDYDLLTGLYNRRAFYAQMDLLFSRPGVLKQAAMVLLDLDNLKYINDTYGHDYGDEYIRSMADVLSSFAEERALCARMSGDEFFLFLYGTEGREELREKLQRLNKTIAASSMQLPDGTAIRIRASAGVAWYPDDSIQYPQLIRYADFAMYQAKHTNKGHFTDFSLESYDRQSYLLHSKEELNQILENSLVSYQFQPIVNGRTAGVLGYEALMRPIGTSIKSPVELLSLAKDQSKLGQVERLTWFKSLEAFSQQGVARSGCKLFINSISSQVLEPRDWEEIERRFGSLLAQVVVEFTEEERMDTQITAEKLLRLNSWQALTALDDFGSGYNGEGMLLALSPHYVKLDLSIIRNIHEDEGRQALFLSLVQFCKEQHIAVIAEGVETHQEMVYLLEHGVDYLQGYYLGRPTYQPAGLADKIRQEILAFARNQHQ